jgi:hypothetical protein
MPAQAIPFRDERVHARDSWQRGWVKPTALPSLVFHRRELDGLAEKQGMSTVHLLITKETARKRGGN